MTADAFGAEAPVVPVTTPVETLVGEGKKFKTVEDLAKGKIESDNYIAQLQAENAGLREVAQKTIDAEAQLNELKNEIKSLRENTSVQPKVPTGPALTEADIEALVERTLTAKEASRTSVQNITESNNRIIRHFGTVEAAQEAVRAKATELNVTVEYLRKTASTSPTAFIQLMGLGAAKPEPAVEGKFLQSSGAAPRVQPTGGEPVEGTKAWLDNVRRKDPGRFFSPDFQQRYVWLPAKAGKSPYAPTN